MANKRRDKGDGSIFQRKTGTWRGYCTIDGRRQYVSGRTKREVQAKLRDLQRQHDAGLNLGQRTQTLGQFLASWLDLMQRTKKPATYRHYELHCRMYIVPALGRIKLVDLRVEQVQALLNQLSERGDDDTPPLAPRTVGHTRAVLRAALTSAVKYGYVLRNVAALAEPPRAEKPRITPLDADQVTRLLAAVDGHRHKALYHTAIQLGMRLAELLDLRWSDVDLAAGTLIIRQGKTESSVRTLPLSASLRQVLTEHWSYQHDERLARGTDWKETGRVFPSEVGTRITPGSLHRHFKRSLAAADLPTTTRWHDLRHTCASLLLQSGVSLKTVSDLLGHSTTAITADIYAHVYHEDKQAAVALWDRLTG